MKQQFEKWNERYNARSFRERILILLAVVAVIYTLWDVVLMNSEVKKQKNMLSQMNGVSQHLANLDEQIQKLNTDVSVDDQSVMQNRIKSVKENLIKLEQQESTLAVQFIKPKQMAGVLRDMLNNERGLTLIRLHSLGASPLLPVNQQAQEKKPEDRKAEIFKHGMVIELEGDFPSTLHYLKTLESMPWRFYWDNVKYEVVKYPKARVTITVHTLSMDEVWIGV